MTISNTSQFVNGKLRHLLGTTDLPLEMIQSIFARASQYQKNPPHTLSGKTVVNAFFESSTRTLSSFELAEKKLGATTLNFAHLISSINKGESFLDTVKTLVAMDIDAIVIRHPEIGSPHRIVSELGDTVAVINAGDGAHAHPTQALLDGYTVSQHKKDFSSLVVAIIGDITNSRVARSQIHLYKILGVKEIRLIGPAALIPDEFHHLGVSICHDLRSGLQDVDVINMLRIQFERMPEVQIHDINAYHKSFGLTAETLAIAKPDAIILHPGPLNRGVEIATDIADGPQSLILEQVRNGVLIRMAILETLLSA